MRDAVGDLHDLGEEEELLRLRRSDLARELPRRAEVAAEADARERGPKRTWVEAKQRSHESAIPSPAPTVGLFTAAIVTFGIRREEPRKLVHLVLAVHVGLERFALAAAHRGRGCRRRRSRGRRR